jgi:hypothetical protein
MGNAMCPPAGSDQHIFWFVAGSQDPIARRRILENTNILDCGLCSGHGTCNNQDDERCECEDGWDAAMNCSTPKNCESSADCSSHGICVKGGHPGRQSDANATRCECDPGWSGLSCNIAACKSSCVKLLCIS